MGILTGEYPRASKQRDDLALPRPTLCIRRTLKTGMPLARKRVRKKETGKGGDAVNADGSAGKGLLLRDGGRAHRCIAGQQLDSDQCRAPAVNCVLLQPIAMNVVGFFPPLPLCLGNELHKTCIHRFCSAT